MSKNKSKKRSQRRKQLRASNRSNQRQPHDSTSDGEATRPETPDQLDTIEKCLKTLSNDIRQGDVWYQLGMAYYDSGQLVEAAECLGNAQGLLDPTPQFFSDFGTVLLECGHTASAYDYFLASLKAIESDFTEDKVAQEASG